MKKALGNRRLPFPPAKIAGAAISGVWRTGILNLAGALQNDTPLTDVRGGAPSALRDGAKKRRLLSGKGREFGRLLRRVARLGLCAILVSGVICTV